MSKCLAFSAAKAPLVLALPVGARFQTMRPMSLRCDPDDVKLIIQDPDQVCVRADDEYLWVKPHYREGEVCHIGVPHWRTPCVLPWIWDEWTKRTRTLHSLDRWEVQAADEMIAAGARLMAGRFLPAWAATAWARILDEPTPCRLLDISEEDAKAELMECCVVPQTAGLLWRDYSADETDGALYSLYSARDSYRTMVAVIYGQKYLDANPWVWRIEAEMVPRPALQTPVWCWPSASSRRARKQGRKGR